MAATPVLTVPPTFTGAPNVVPVLTVAGYFTGDTIPMDLPVAAMPDGVTLEWVRVATKGCATDSDPGLIPIKTVTTTASAAGAITDSGSGTPRAGRLSLVYSPADTRAIGTCPAVADVQARLSDGTTRTLGTLAFLLTQDVTLLDADVAITPTDVVTVQITDVQTIDLVVT